MARICRIPSSFQFTPLREGRRILFPPTVLFSNFNSRPSARGDQQIKRITIFQHYFNSRPSARGDTRNRRHCWQWQRFQFTPLREGRRAAAAQSSAAINISIHAPPRGATSDAGRSLQSSNISIHAPPRGATITCERRYPISNISIHAPPRGATLYGTQFEELHVHFNSRPSARGDTRRARLSGQRRGYFNSRPSARGDPAAPVCPRPSRPHFNSRPSARGDIIKEDKPVNIFLISIHAPPRGATAAACGNRYLSNTFQFTPLREGRRYKRHCG